MGPISYATPWRGFNQLGISTTTTRVQLSNPFNNQPTSSFANGGENTISFKRLLNGAINKTGDFFNVFSDDVHNFAYGIGTFARGVFRGGRQLARLTGLAGDSEQIKSITENIFFGLALKGALSDPESRSKTLDYAADFASNNKAKVAGRLSVGPAISIFSPAAAISFSILAPYGDGVTITEGLVNRGRDLADIDTFVIGITRAIVGGEGQ